MHQAPTAPPQIQYARRYPRECWKLNELQASVEQDLENLKRFIDESSNATKHSAAAIKQRLHVDLKQEIIDGLGCACVPIQ